MTHSVDSWMAAVTNVVTAAIAYVDSEEPGESKDLLFSLESAVQAYRDADSLERAREQQVWVQCRSCGATGAANDADCGGCSGNAGWHVAESRAPALDEHGERWG